MKIATWNVNGIRARQAELQDFIERETPVVLCLQEIKAAIDQLPVWLCELEGYWCYWHGGKGYSGVGLHVRKATCQNRPAFDHPEFDYEHRIVAAQLPQATVASIYVPNGGKDFPAKMRFLEAMDAYAAEFEASERPLIMCGDLNVTRTAMAGHPKERPPSRFNSSRSSTALAFLNSSLASSSMWCSTFSLSTLTLAFHKSVSGGTSSSSSRITSATWCSS